MTVNQFMKLVSREDAVLRLPAERTGTVIPGLIQSDPVYAGPSHHVLMAAFGAVNTPQGWRLREGAAVEGAAESEVDPS